ncbi:hypothetical protein K0M31_010487, partial [Melipona bicolor]
FVVVLGALTEKRGHSRSRKSGTEPHSFRVKQPRPSTDIYGDRLYPLNKGSPNFQSRPLQKFPLPRTNYWDCPWQRSTSVAANFSRHKSWLQKAGIILQNYKAALIK